MPTKAKKKTERSCICPDLPYVLAPGCEPKCPVHGDNWLDATTAQTIREAGWKNGGK